MLGTGHPEEVARNEQGCIQDEQITNKSCPQISNQQFTLAMANASMLNTGGSQFFINLADNIGHD
jgi:cyclophilin family peptidyl-prolyl cis-trans isomerase